MSIIFPDESKMNTEDLIVFKKELTELIYNDSYDINDLNKIKNIIHRLEGYLLMADKKKKFQYFDSFYELGLLNILNSLLNKGNSQISFCILECIYILLTNIQNTGLIFYLYSSKFQTFIPGEYLNIIDKIISIDARKKDEFLTYQVNFIKSLTLKLNKDCIDFFFDKNKNQFPILNKAFSLYNNKDAMIRSAVKNIVLTILKINDEHLRRFMTAFPNNIYYPNIIFQLRNLIMKLCLINFFEESKKNSIDLFRDQHDNLIDHMYYIADLLLIGIESVNFIIINCILNEIILPLLKTIISKKEEKISIVLALYILILFIYIVKNKFINDVISYLLFEENISKKLFEKIEEFEFKSINNSLMNNINSLIIHNQFADVNDLEWKNISKYMADVTGLDLSTDFIIKDNNYNIIKDIIYKNNENDLLIRNEILINIQMLFTAKDDCILLILNLLINSEISFYTKNNNNEKNVNNNIINKNTEKEITNNISNNKEENNIINNNYKDNNKSNNINNIDEDLIEKIKDELFDDENENENEININNVNNNSKNKENNINKNLIDNINNNIDLEYKLLNNKFFHINLLDSKNLFNLLLKLIEIPKNFLSINNEIILTNLFLLLQNFKSDDNKHLIQKLTEIFKGEINKLKKKLSENNNLKKLAFDNTYKAFEQYMNPIDKKVKDLITSPFILIPLIYLDTEEDTPSYLKEDKFGNQQLKIYIINIFILYDILNYLLGFSNNMIIKSKKYPLEIPTNNIVLGKEYSNKELGEEKFLFETIINNKIFKTYIFFDFEYIYFGHILSNSFKDLSKIKIIKKIALRNLIVKISENDDDYEENNTLLEIYDNSEVGGTNKKKNYLIINCFKADNTLGMYNILKQQRNNALQLEYSLFESYIDAIDRKISVI